MVIQTRKTKSIGLGYLSILSHIRRYSVDLNKVFVACSGGSDSLALCAIISLLKKRNVCQCINAVIIDHGINNDSDIICKKTENILFNVLNFDNIIIKNISINKQCYEEEARIKRYIVLLNIAKKYNVSIFLGHTKNDQVESFFLGLKHGSGLKSLTGMRPVNGIYHRPFLSLNKNVTQDICKDFDIQYHNDIDNHKFIRGDIRYKLLPVLQECIGNNVFDAIFKTMNMFQEDLDILNKLIVQYTNICYNNKILDLNLMLLLSTSIQKRILHYILNDIISSKRLINSRHVQLLFNIVQSKKNKQTIYLPEYNVAIKKNNKLFFYTSN